MGVSPIFNTAISLESFFNMDKFAKHYDDDDSSLIIETFVLLTTDQTFLAFHWNSLQFAGHYLVSL